MWQAHLRGEKFDVLVVDPPWNQGKTGYRGVRPNQTKKLDYPTLSKEEIIQLPINEWSKNNCFIWNRFLFDDASPEIDDIARGHHYDLTLLLDVDVPFVDDVVRYIPDQRQAFFQACMDMLDAKQAPYVVLRGSWNNRRKQAIHAISSL